MKNAALIVCGLLAAVQGRTINTNAVYEPRVVNGKEAKLGEIPYQVALLNDYGMQFCGGSILNEYWIVTAAHCVQGISASRVQIAAGLISLRDLHSVHKVVELIVHEKFQPRDSYRNDIALLKVATAFKFSSRIKPVILPKLHAKVKTNSSAVVSGWGYTSNGSQPDILQKATVYITDPKVCQAAVQVQNLTIHSTQVCANDPTIRRGECNGDSGGPVTVNGVLTGIVSWSIKSDEGCGSPIYPGVHTRVSEYIDWIQQHINTGKPSLQY